MTNYVHPILRFFEFEHLKGDLQRISKAFNFLAHDMACELPVGQETDMALRKLLEAKDCAVRSMLPTEKK